jgi:8-oxo-dGTP pyrophosphatase MutT (NUDIX family)
LRLIPVSLALFYRQLPDEVLEVWTQVREDDGIYHCKLEFPGGGIEAGEDPLTAAVREVEEEVGIIIKSTDAKFMGIYSNILETKTILLNVFLFPDQPGLATKGQWLRITKDQMSGPYKGQIPGPNHQMIDDLYRSLYSASK